MCDHLFATERSPATGPGDAWCTGDSGRSGGEPVNAG